MPAQCLPSARISSVSAHLPNIPDAVSLKTVDDAPPTFTRPFALLRFSERPTWSRPWDAQADIGSGVIDPEGHPRGRDGSWYQPEGERRRRDLHVCSYDLPGSVLIHCTLDLAAGVSGRGRGRAPGGVSGHFVGWDSWGWKVFPGW